MESKRKASNADTMMDEFVERQREVFAYMDARLAELGLKVKKPKASSPARSRRSNSGRSR